MARRASQSLSWDAPLFEIEAGGELRLHIGLPRSDAGNRSLRIEFSWGEAPDADLEVSLILLKP